MNDAQQPTANWRDTVISMTAYGFNKQMQDAYGVGYDMGKFGRSTEVTLDDLLYHEDDLPTQPAAQQHVLTQDEDSHWYVIPADKQDEFQAYIEAVTRYWEDMPDDQEPPTEPDWAIAIGGAPSLVKFSNYEIG